VSETKQATRGGEGRKETCGQKIHARKAGGSVKTQMEIVSENDQGGGGGLVPRINVGESSNNNRGGGDTKNRGGGGKVGVGEAEKSP